MTTQVERQIFKRKSLFRALGYSEAKLTRLNSTDLTNRCGYMPGSREEF